MQNNPLDEEGSRTFFNNIVKLWVEPELNKRLQEGNPYTRDIHRCLILLPTEEKQVVNFTMR